LALKSAKCAPAKNSNSIKILIKRRLDADYESVKSCREPNAVPKGENEIIPYL
jgi:hypothetical protein